MVAQNRLLLLFLFVSVSLAQTGYPGWSHYKLITLNTKPVTGAGVSTLTTRFPLLVRLSSNEADVFSAVQTSGADIRFCKASDGTPLPYQVEIWDKTNRSAAIWVLMDSIAGSDSVSAIRMYWGNSSAPDISQGSGVFDTANGFQAVWHLSDPAGETARDATVNGYGGTPGGTAKPADAAGAAGHAKAFDGVTAFYVMKGTRNGKLNFAQNSTYTVSAWVNVDAVTGSDQIIVSKGALQWNCKLMGGWRAFEYVSGPTAGYDGVEASPAVANIWKYISFVRSGTTKHLYVDGVLRDDNPYMTPNPGPRTDTNDVEIGKKPNQTVGYLKGKIDEVCLANKARSAGWVKLCFENQKPAGQSLVSLGATQTGITRIMNAGSTTAGVRQKRNVNRAFQYNKGNPHRVGIVEKEGYGNKKMYDLGGKAIPVK